VNNTQAKKIALRRASKILRSTLGEGWTPNDHGYFYNEKDTDRILTSMAEICDELLRRSIGNREDSPIKH
jgi:hypothetical protein